MNFRDFITEEALEVRDMKLEDLYDKFNKDLFNNQLPKVPIKLTKSKHSGGSAIASRNTQTGKVTIKGITISTLYKRSIEELSGLLIHEMVHIYFYLIGDAYEAHGSKFKKKLEELQSKVDFKIPLTDDFENKEVSNHVKKKPYDIVLLQFPDKHYSIVSFKYGSLTEFKDQIHRFIDKWVDHYKVIPEYYESDEVFLQTLPSKRGLSGTIASYKITDEQAKLIKDNGTKL